jgi:DNA-binding GntR family transcriptional regulator
MKQPPPSSTRTDRVITLLRRRIIQGQSKPGSLLAEAAVAMDLGVSRVPVREALLALERDGLVEFSDTGRAYVKELSPHDFEELYVLRLTLEPVAARLAAPALRENASALEKNIAATRKARRLPDVTRLDLDFHEIVLDLSGNARLLRLWRSIRGELEMWLGRLQHLHRDQRLDTREQTAHSHEQLVERFRTRPAAECERAMREHILGWREWLPASFSAPRDDTARAGYGNRAKSNFLPIQSLRKPRPIRPGHRHPAQ